MMTGPGRGCGVKPGLATPAKMETASRPPPGKTHTRRVYVCVSVCVFTFVGEPVSTTALEAHTPSSALSHWCNYRQLTWGQVILQGRRSNGWSLGLEAKITV